jgi:hypothetical protein
MYVPKLPRPAVTRPIGPQVIPPPGVSPPTAVRPSGGFDLASFKLPDLGAVGKRVGDAVSSAGRQLASAAVSKATEATPPLSQLAGRLGPLAGPAQAALKYIQPAVQNPAQFASYATTLGKPLVGAAMDTPFGIPAMLGLHASLAGGQAAGDAYTVFSPLLKRLGVG